MKKYIESFIEVDNEKLIAIIKEEQERQDIQPSIGSQVGKLLGLLIRAMDAKRVLEFGTCIGYSTIWLAEAVKFTGGKLTSIEYDKKLYNETKKNLQSTNLLDYVDLLLGDANEVIDSLEGKFDVILQDSAKPLYPIMVDKCVKLLRKNGLLIADDTLFKPLGIPEKFSYPIDEYNKKIFKNSNLYSTILPIGDGITISVKLND